MACNRAAARTSAISSAFCSPVEQDAAGTPAAIPPAMPPANPPANPPAMPPAAKRTARSTRCGPTSARPASASGAREALSCALRASSATSEGAPAAIDCSAPVERTGLRIGQRPGQRPGQRQIRGREGRDPFGASRGQPRHEIGARRGNGNALLRHRRFQRVQPGRIGAGIPEQPVSFAHGSLVGRQMRGVARQEAGDQPVQEAAPRAGRPAEQAVHLRRQPDDGAEGRQARPALSPARHRCARPAGPRLGPPLDWAGAVVPGIGGIVPVSSPVSAAGSRPVPTRRGPSGVSTVALTAQFVSGAVAGSLRC